MLVNIPNFRGEESHTLYVIGNGFDLRHDIKSKYRHFCSWLNLNDYESFVDDMEWFFSHLDYRQCTLWSNFENVLKTYDTQEIYDKLRHKTEDVWNEEALENSVKELRDLTHRIRPLMKKWAQNIDIKKQPLNLFLSPQSLYMTFNYTEVLEEIYHIPESKICHIHGSVNSEEVLAGHNKTRFPYDIQAKTDEEERPRRKIVEIMNDLDKRIEQNIKEMPFFDTLQEISNVVVIGHSMSSIDRRYFTEIRNRVLPNSKWFFSTYDGSEKMNRDSFLEESKSIYITKPISTENVRLFKF